MNTATNNTCFPIKYDSSMPALEQAKLYWTAMRESMQGYQNLLLELPFDDPAVKEIGDWLNDFKNELEMDNMQYQIKLLEKSKKEKRKTDPPEGKTRSIGFVH